MPSQVVLCAQPSATPCQTLSEGDKPPETDGVLKPVPIKDGKVKVDDANVVKTDVFCTNGVIHVIDAVILPK